MRSSINPTSPQSANFKAEYSRFEYNFPSFKPVASLRLKNPVCFIIYSELDEGPMYLYLSQADNGDYEENKIAENFLYRVV